MTEFQAEMEPYDEEWAASQAEPRQSFLPDGVYQARVDECRIEQNDWGWSWVTRFVDTGGKGSIRAFRNLDHEVGRDIAAKDAATLGYKGKLSDLGAACEEGVFNDLIVEIKVQTKPAKDGSDKTYTNVFVNRALGRGEAAPVGQADDSDIPF